MARKNCGCPKGATKKMKKKGSRGLPFVCMVNAKMPRIVKSKANGKCPTGAKKKRMGKSGMRCVALAMGKKFIGPVGCASKSGKSRSKKRKKRRKAA